MSVSRVDAPLAGSASGAVPFGGTETSLNEDDPTSAEGSDMSTFSSSSDAGRFMAGEDDLLDVISTPLDGLLACA